MLRKVARALPAATAALAALLVSAAASAQLPEAPAEPDDAADTPGRGRPVPRDDRTGLLHVFAGPTFIVPAGDLGSGLAFQQVADPGLGFLLGLGIGIARSAALDIRGQYGRLARAGGCLACSTQMFAAGFGVQYHATQALGFDPWVRFGAGYRALLVEGDLASLVSTAPPAGTFHGVDVASFSLGGDYFPLRWFGVGLFFEGDVGVMARAPSAQARGAVYGLFQAGLRIALEPQRKAATAASSGAPRRTANVEY